MATHTAAGTSAPWVRLIIPHRVLAAGQTVQVGIVNTSSRPILHGICLILQRHEPNGWKTITETHGVHVGCPPAPGPPLGPHAHDSAPLTLYDDLQPGPYRLTLVYKPLPPGRAYRLAGNDRCAHLELTVLKFDPGPKPQLPESRILHLALAAAAGAGDPNPTLIQHSEGSRFAANLVDSGDLVFAWQWSYLIAIRGNFVLKNSTGLGSSPPKGSVITLIVDAKKGQTGDFGISNHYPRLAELGPVTTDRRG